MKKKMFIGISVIIGMLFTINIYGYINNVKVSKYIEDSTILRKKIMVLDEFRSDIVKTSQLQKLYILTQKQSYKDSFDKNIKSIYSQIDSLYSKGYISKYEKDKLTYTMNEYEQLSLDSLNYPSNYIIEPQLEKQITRFNASQLKILHEVTMDISSENEDLESTNKKVSNSSNIQTKLIQGVSSIITILVSGFAYYFKTKFKIDDQEIEKIVDYLTNSESNDLPKSTIPENKSIDVSEIDYLSQLKDKICENEILLSNANLLYKQSIKFQTQCDKSELILKDIDMYISKLKVKLENIDEYPSIAQKIILDDIENQLLEFKILFKSLPNYNDFIIEISKNMIKKD